MTEALDRLGSPGRVEAIVAVEQARAVAQVAAAVEVAQRFPRDLARVRAEVAEACGHYELASRAFYAVENRGEGKSVHLARALAVIWGNLDYGVHELRRDDLAGSSEVQAFAWDLQRNSKHTRTFQVPHQAMKGRGRNAQRVPILDLNDVYRNNQNVGARAVRECVFGVLPRDLVDLAERLCRETLQRGDGTPLAERAQRAIGAFARLRVSREQLEARVGGPVEQWTAEDVAGLQVVWQSIREGDTTVEDQFDPAAGRVTAAEVLGPEQPPRNVTGTSADVRPDAPEPVGDQRPATAGQVQRVVLMLRDLDVEDDDAQRDWLSRELQREVGSRRDLTRGEASTVIDVLGVLIAERDEQAAGRAT